MQLGCLLVTRDAEVLNVMTDAFTRAGVDLRLRENASSAVEIAERHHFDGFIVDCDDLQGGAGLLRGLRQTRANQQSLIFAVVNGRTSVGAALEAGADFVLGKPIDPDRLHSCLKLAVPTMERAHRRCFRYPVQVRGEIVLADGQALDARLFNVSEGGFGIRLSEGGKLAYELEQAFLLRCAVPGLSQGPLETRATLAWSAWPVCGLRILGMTHSTRNLLQHWLTTIELQMV